MSQSIPGGSEAANGGEEQFFAVRRRESTGIEAAAWDVLDDIEDPHMPISLVEMAMIYDVTVDGEEAVVDMTFPCLGCPAYDMIQDDIRDGLASLETVEDVRINMVWEPVWTKELLAPDVRSKLQESGIGI